MKYGVPVHVRSSFSDSPGTWVAGEEKSLEDVVVAGVAYDKGEAKVLLQSVMDKPGVVAKIFGNVDPIGKTIRAGQGEYQVVGVTTAGTTAATGEAATLIAHDQGAAE